MPVGCHFRVKGLAWADAGRQAVRPRYGALVVVAWLAGIIVNLLLLGKFYDVALRDFGLLVGALALSRLATRRSADPDVPRR